MALFLCYDLKHWQFMKSNLSETEKIFEFTKGYLAETEKKSKLMKDFVLVDLCNIEKKITIYENIFLFTIRCAII